MHYPTEHVTHEAPGSVFKFWVGDISYHPAMKEVWDDVCDGYDFDVAAIQLFNGRLMAAHGTAYGDGEFVGTDGYHYAVDAGILGFVEWERGDGEVEGMCLIDFREMPTVDYHHGEVCIGMNTPMGITIDTTGPHSVEEEAPDYDDGGDDDTGLSDDY